MSYDDETPAPHDRFGDALALCAVANNKTIATALKKLRRVNRQIADAEGKVMAAEAKAAEIVAKAHSDVKTIHEEARQRLEAAESAEQQNALREQKIARLESAWRYIGEPGDVLSGLRSPEFSPLQKARMAHGQQPGKNPDRLFSEADAEPVVAIDALIRRDVGDERSDAQGNAFAPSTLHRDVTHKRGAA